MTKEYPAPTWQEISKCQLDAPWLPWLGHRPSLTKRLTEMSKQQCYVMVMYQGWDKPYQDELAILGLEDELSWVREVVLYCDKQAMVFARSIFPRALFENDGRFHHLGAQGLGTELFKDPNIQREDIEVATVNKKHLLFNHCQKMVENSAEELLARRSIFSIKKQQLLVCEVFLPHVATL